MFGLGLAGMMSGYRSFICGKLLLAASVVLLLITSPRISLAWDMQRRAASFATPFEIALLYPYQLAGGPVYGLRLSLLGGINPSLVGIDLGLGMGLIGDKHDGDPAHSLTGVQMNGLFSSASGNIKGVQVSGLVSLSSQTIIGVQVAGLFNYTGRINGLQIAGLGNLTGVLFEHSPQSDKPGSGIQVAALVNNGHFNGIQMSAWNVNPGNAIQIGVLNNGGNGVQVGVINTQTESGVYHGAQFGLLNIVEDGMEGMQVGVINGIGELYGTLNGLSDPVISRGVQVGLISTSNALHGVQIGIVNISKNLRGVQVGIYNQANNARHHVLPLMNAAF